MTDKQIIIDGVDVSGCRYLFDDTSYKRSKTSCSITLKDCKYLGNNCYYKQLKAKEQECEKLKLDLIEAKAHGDYLNNLALSETLNLASEQLDQLKAENEILEKDKANLEVIKETLKVQFKQLKQTLIEIREIAKPYNDMSGNCVIVNTFKDMNEILQKINECEVDK